MVDHVYARSLPSFRERLARLRRRFRALGPVGEAWIATRVDPLARHVRALERRLDAPMPRGAVPMLRSDLIYLRANLAALEDVLDRMSG